MAANGTIMQYFHWYYPSDGSLWNKVAMEAPNLAKTGITALWLPPAYKGNGGAGDVGYGVYDMYDLGEFDQKSSIRTKYGTKDQFLSAIGACHKAGMQVYADVVFNHRGGADETEWVKAVRVREDNRNFSYGEEVWIEAWTRFNFAGRNNKYSDFKWRYYHFSGVDWAQNFGEKAIFKFLTLGKDWQQLVSGERGNYDYLMFTDIDMDHPEVRTELARWGRWFLEFTGIDGFRLDAVKHIKYNFFRDWLDYLRRATGRDLFTVGEYWNEFDLGILKNYIQHTGGRMSLFDAPLHRNFYNASRQPDYDMRRLLDNTLMQHDPIRAVTLVDNHDTQPCQALESPVDWWFKPLAYAFILLREQGYPCVFYPDFYGASYNDKGQDINLMPVKHLPQLIKIRQTHAYGKQHDYLDHWSTIGWTREGNDKGTGAAVLITNSNEGGIKRMFVGKQHAGQTYTESLHQPHLSITIDHDGFGNFAVLPRNVAVWLPKV